MRSIKKWFADTALIKTKTYLKTTTHFLCLTKMDIRLDPVAVSFAIGYHF